MGGVTVRDVDVSSALLYSLRFLVGFVWVSAGLVLGWKRLGYTICKTTKRNSTTDRRLCEEADANDAVLDRLHILDGAGDN
jgi:hypothetical protein